MVNYILFIIFPFDPILFKHVCFLFSPSVCSLAFASAEDAQQAKEGFQQQRQWYHSDIWRPWANVFSEVLKWHWVTHTLAFFKWKREKMEEVMGSQENKPFPESNTAMV
jgi:hypothetical protein